MDSSLASIDWKTGELQNQWRLADRRLSLRHLARHANGSIAVALQAQHDDVVERAGAPVLALFDPATGTLATVSGSSGLAGYAGDIASIGDQWVVACPRSNLLVHFSIDGQRTGQQTLAAACAVAALEGTAMGWATGHGAVAAVGASTHITHLAPALEMDNHAVLLPG